jgi:hypothetical protein
MKKHPADTAREFFSRLNRQNWTTEQAEAALVSVIRMAYEEGREEERKAQEPWHCTGQPAPLDRDPWT